MTVPTYTKLKLTDNRKEVRDYLKTHGYLIINPTMFESNGYLYINHVGVSFDNDEHFFNNHRYTEVFFYDGAFHYENEQTKNDKGKEIMTTKINYTNDWHIDYPETEEEWDIFVKIMEHFGVNVYSKKYESYWSYVGCSTQGNQYLVCTNNTSGTREVSLLEAIALLQRPVKTEQQMEIEELEAVITKSQQRLKELKSKHV